MRALRAIAVLVAIPLLVAADCDVSISPTDSPPTLKWEVRDRETGHRFTYTDGDTHDAPAEARLNVTLHVEDPAGIKSVIFYGGQTGGCKDSLGYADQTYRDQRLDFTEDAADGTAPSKWTAGFQPISGSCPTGGAASVNAEVHGYASNFSGLDRNSTLYIRIPLPSVSID